jgi:hypothetical protein
MIKRILYLLLLILGFESNTNAQTDTSHLRVSLLTCGTGEEIWETFGHTAVRVTDSVNGTDNVYNYGTFNGFGDDFELQFMRGKLLYYVSFYPYKDFLLEYSEYHRSVEEQVLIAGGKEKQKIFDYLKNNALEENRYYKYDFFFDNCATRIRDIFPKALGDKFHYNNVLPAGHPLTFRNIMDQYFYRVHWERVGCDILLGSRIDKVMTNADIMFLPDYLRDGLANATVEGKKIVTPTQGILSGSEHKEAGINQPFVVMAIVCLLTFIGLAFKPLKVLGNTMSFLILFVTGLLGCLIVVMWLGTDHQGCQNNFNILWALPTNIAMAFAGKKNKSRYAIVGILLLLVSLLLHVFSVQELPLLEIGPLLVALLFIYASIYRRSRVSNAV